MRLRISPAVALQMGDYSPQVRAAISAALIAWLPPPDLTVSEWAERYAVLPPESSSEPGKWHAIPYQVAMMDACCHPRVERVSIIKSKRTGYTKCMGNLIGYHVHQDPCSILVVQPTLDDAEGWSKEELTPTVEQTEILSKLIAPPRAKDSGNTILRKRYPGGILHVVGANSARGFRRITVRLALFDEVDGYPPSAGNEGDPEKLAEGRTETAWNRKIIKGSTPTEAGISRIGRAWRESSQGHYVLSCPHCAGEHIRRFVVPEKPVVIRNEAFPVSHLDHATGEWVCPACQVRMDHGQHRALIEGGYWRGEHWEWRNGQGFTFLEGFSGHIGMHIWAGYSYSPNSTPDKLIAEYNAVKDDAEQLKTFVNTVLGEEWIEPGEQLDHDVLAARAEQYPAEVPPGAVVLTCGVDVQGDRLELEIVGWGEREESWSIDYQVLVGDPTQDDVWDDLAEVLKDGRWIGPGGRPHRVSAACIDSGYLPRRVYRFVRAQRSAFVWPTKGRAGAYPVIESKTIQARRAAKRKKEGAAPEMIGVDEAKAILYRRLRLSGEGPGVCHFPADRDLEWFKQLTGERCITRYPRGGAPTREWVRVYRAVEALDCRVLAHAALLLSKIPLVPRPVEEQRTADQPPPRPPRRSFGGSPQRIIR